jgi:hypothetical protein
MKRSSLQPRLPDVHICVSGADVAPAGGWTASGPSWTGWDYVFPRAFFAGLELLLGDDPTFGTSKAMRVSSRDVVSTVAFRRMVRLSSVGETFSETKLSTYPGKN